MTLMALFSGLTFLLLGVLVPQPVLWALLILSNCMVVLALAMIVIESTRCYDVSALGLFSWGMALSETGIMIGANLFRLAEAYQVAELATGALVLGLAAFALFAVPAISIDGVIDGLRRPPEAVPIKDAGLGDSTLEAEAGQFRTREIAEAYALTPREEEVFALLARGRNGAYIQEKLCISRNTYKTHSRHIYEKLVVHNQQEVIDLVETFRP